METAIINLTAKIDKLFERIDAIEKKMAAGPCAGPAAAAVGDGETSPAQREFDELVETHLKSNLGAAKAVSDTLHEQMLKFIAACEDLSKIIGVASRTAKPDSMEKVKDAAKPLFDKIQEIGAYKDKYFKNKEFNNIAGVSEGGPALTWFLVEKTPAPYLNDVIPSAEFYTNRVLTATKGKDESQFKWAKDFAGFLRGMQAYVKRVHTTGLLFNPSGGSFVEAMATALPSSAPAAAAPAAAAAAPAPAPASSKPASVNTAGIFSAINKGTDISKGLKHVTNDMKTKNRTPEERAKVLEPKKPADTKAKPAAAAAKPAKPASNQRVGNKLVVENFTEGQVVLDDTRLNDMVYIGNCRNCVVQIKGKVNGVTVDACTKTGVVCENIVAVVELVNCHSSQLQITGKAPSVNVDKCDGVQVYLSEAGVEAKNQTKIYTSKSSAVNILAPGPNPDSDMLELPVPEQFCSIVADGKLTTEFASHV